MGSVMEHASVGMVSFKFKMGRWRNIIQSQGETLSQGQLFGTAGLFELCNN